jgi:hypothetical protein
LGILRLSRLVGNQRRRCRGELSLSFPSLTTVPSFVPPCPSLSVAHSSGPWPHHHSAQSPQHPPPRPPLSSPVVQQPSAKPPQRPFSPAAPSPPPLPLPPRPFKCVGSLVQRLTEPSSGRLDRQHSRDVPKRRESASGFSQLSRRSLTLQYVPRRFSAHRNFVWEVAGGASYLVRA